MTAPRNQQPGAPVNAPSPHPADAALPKAACHGSWQGRQGKRPESPCSSPRKVARTHRPKARAGRPRHMCERAQQKRSVRLVAPPRLRCRMGRRTGRPRQGGAEKRGWQQSRAGRLARASEPGRSLGCPRAMHSHLGLPALSAGVRPAGMGWLLVLVHLRQPWQTQAPHGSGPSRTRIAAWERRAAKRWVQLSAGRGRHRSRPMGRGSATGAPPLG